MPNDHPDAFVVSGWTRRAWGLAVLAAGCGGRLVEPQSSSGEPLSAVIANGATGSRLEIVATTGMVGDLVAATAGPLAAVTALIAGGVDPHLYKPTRRDLLRLASADAVFYSGLHLEGRMQDVFVRLRRSGRAVEAVTAELRQRPGQPAEQFTAANPDPHVWMDVSLWRDCLPLIVNRLSDWRPAAASQFAEQAAGYAAQLDELDRYIQRVIGSIPAERRILVTAHDAFGYFARRYGMTIRSVQGLSTESEAGVSDVNRLVKELVEWRLPAIFVESSLSPRLLEAVVEGVRRRGGEIRIGGELFSDAMGTAGTYEGTYLGMLDHNATTIARELGGDAPARGWQNRLAVR